MSAEAGTESKSRISPEEEALQAFSLLMEIQKFTKDLTANNYPQPVVEHFSQGLMETFDRFHQSMRPDAKGQFAVLKDVSRAIAEDQPDAVEIAPRRLKLYGFKPNQVENFMEKVISKHLDFRP